MVASPSRVRRAPRGDPDALGLVVALDGPASSGKSSVGSAAARALGLRFVDTGLLYRALTALSLREGVAPADPAGLVSLVDRVALADDGEGRLVRVLLDGEDATAEARSHEVDAAVSAVARVPEVRKALMPRQRELAAQGGIVVAGRDIGTVVLPDAGLKLYLDASVEERAQRRIEERGIDPSSPEAEEVRAELRARDHKDGSRAVAPMRPADDAVILHTDGNAFEQTVALVVGAIREAAARETAPPPPPTPTDRPAGADRPARREPADDPLTMANDQSMLVRMVALIARLGARLVADVRIEGIERVPRTGPVILAPNHISNADPVVVGAFLTPRLGRRRIHWMAKREVLDWPVFGWIGRHGGVHGIDRSTADVEAFRLATRLLEAGYVMMLFPEGTRSPTGSLQPAKDGLAMLALRTEAVIVPIGVNGSDAVWPKGRRFPSPLPRRTIRVRFGEPFRVADVVPAGTERRELKTAATRAIMGRIAALLDERHRGVYADAVPPPA